MTCRNLQAYMCGRKGESRDPITVPATHLRDLRRPNRARESSGSHAEQPLRRDHSLGELPQFLAERLIAAGEFGTAVRRRHRPFSVQRAG